MKAKKATPQQKENCLNLISQCAHRLPDAEIFSIAAKILETFGYICIPPEVVAKGRKKTG